ncbi:MAG: FtsX-like permease family protein [Crocinitomicaceae bacterium]
MAFEYFISRKTLKSVIKGKRVSQPIVRISIISIALAMIVNLITIAIVTGFQQEVRQKITGFGSHIFLMTEGEVSIYESSPFVQSKVLNDSILSIKGVKNIQSVGFKPVLFQSNKSEIAYKLPNGKDTVESQLEVSGSIVKGVDNHFDWTFFENHLVEGRVPKIRNDSPSNEVLISLKLASQLAYNLNDEISAFFVRNQPVKRKFKIVGIYRSGMEEFDQKMVISDLKYVQELNDWGIKSSIRVADTLDKNGNIIIYGDVSGGNGNYRYDWGKGFGRQKGFITCPKKDTIIRLIISDYWSDIDASILETTISDTSYLKIKLEGDNTSSCNIQLNEIDEIHKSYLNDNGSKFKVNAGSKIIAFEAIDGKGSSKQYIGGLEVIVHKWEDLETTFEKINEMVSFKPDERGQLLKVSSILENESDIFVWLGFLDINVWIILTLMILIGIINMGSALLALILIRSNFIGLLKSMGASNWYIRKIFLYQAGFLIGRGMIYGNIIGITLCVIQQQFGLFPLNPEVYYLTEVPVQLDLLHIILLNLGTMIICISALIIPSMVISRIQPAKSIKFN